MSVGGSGEEQGPAKPGSTRGHGDADGLGKPQWEQDLRLAHPELSQHKLRPLSLAYESAFMRANGQGPKHNDGAGFCRTRPVGERYGLTATERKAAKYAAGREYSRLTAIGRVVDKAGARVTRARNKPIFKKTDVKPGRGMAT
jgi:hypothetical protein